MSGWNKASGWKKARSNGPVAAPGAEAMRSRCWSLNASQPTSSIAQPGALLGSAAEAAAAATAARSTTVARTVARRNVAGGDALDQTVRSSPNPAIEPDQVGRIKQGISVGAAHFLDTTHRSTHFPRRQTSVH